MAEHTYRGVMTGMSDLVEMIRAANARYGITELDGTYVVREVDYVNGASRWGLERVSEHDGYEVGYDSIAPESTPTEGGPRAFLTPGDRVGVWTHDGVVYFDRTAHVRGPWEIAAIIGRDCDQTALWDWSAQRSISVETGGTVE